MKKALIAAVAFIGLLAIPGCNPADVASHNLSKAADHFQISRRIVFFNGITDTYLMTIEGLCSLGNHDKNRELSVTCKVGPTSYKKHFLGLSDNVSYFVEQVEDAKVSTYHYRVIFRPQTIIPSIGLDIGN